MTFWDSPYGAAAGWRYSLAVQFIPSAIFALGLPFLPETSVMVPNFRPSLLFLTIVSPGLTTSNQQTPMARGT